MMGEEGMVGVRNIGELRVIENVGQACGEGCQFAGEAGHCAHKSGAIGQPD